MPPMPARRALALGRILVVPSRRESLPYVVLEAAAAGKPLIAVSVGGIPEIYGALARRWFHPTMPAALAKAIARSLDDPAAAADIARQLRERVAGEFSVNGMVAEVLEAYQSALAKPLSGF